jgi:hypothetical protein
VVKGLKKKVDAQIGREKDTAAYLLFQIGLRVNNYLGACERAESIDDVPKSILNMDSIEDKIRNLELVPVLPTSFKNCAKRELEEEKDEEADGPNGGKRGRGNDGKKHGGAKVVRNENLFDDLTLKDGEKWKPFSGREARTDLPAWGKNKMCLKWHIKGICFSDCTCTDIESHVPKNEVPADKHKAMVAWKKSKTT